MRGLAGLLFAAACCAATNTVVVLENSPGMETWLAQTAVPRLPRGDGMGIMTFSGKPRLRQAITGDRAMLRAALGRILSGRVGLGVPRRAPFSSAPVFEAVSAAARLLAGKGGRIILLFGSEQPRAALAAPELQQALLAAHIRLDAVAVRRSFPLAGPARDAQTPPTLPGRPAVRASAVALPEATLETLKPICRATGGAATAGQWNLGAMMAP